MENLDARPSRLGLPATAFPGVIAVRPTMDAYSATRRERKQLAEYRKWRRGQEPMPFVPNDSAQDRARRLWMRKEKTREIWRRIARSLRRYHEVCTPAALLHAREGWWVLAAGMTLLVCNVGAARFGYASLWALLAAAIAADLLVVNTTIVFVTKKPVSPLRSVLFTFGGYVNLALAFSVGWVVIGRNESTWNRVLSAFYQSVRTLATIGPDNDLVATDAGSRAMMKALTVGEVLVGLYVLSIVIANYASWAGDQESRTEGDA